MFIPKLIAVLIGIAIAYLITRLAKKRKLNIFWAFYFSLLMPLLGLILTLLRFKTETLNRKPSTPLKVTAIILMIYGLILLFEAASTQPDSKTLPKTPFQQNYESLGGIKTGDPGKDLFWNETSAYVGRVIGGGICSISLDNDTFLTRDYRVKRYFRFYVGVILLSIGSFLIRKRRLLRDESSQIDLTENITTDSSTLLSNLLIRINKYQQYIKYSVISIAIGVFFGGYLRTPNKRLLDFVSDVDSEWQKELTIERARKSSHFFFCDSFSFNWAAFFISALISIFLILFLFDKPFRQFIYNRFSFSEEKKSQ